MSSRNRGKPKPKLRYFSLEHPSEEEMKAVNDVLFNGPPIVVAIIGAAMVETELEVLLRRRLTRRDDETWKRVAGDSGPLHTLDHKITLGHALGIFDDCARENLNIIRTIRNAFAHAKKPLDFENELVRKELAAIALPARRRSSSYKALHNAKTMRYGAQLAFTSLCVRVTIVLIKKKGSLSTRAWRRRTKRQAARFAAQMRGSSGGLLGSWLAEQTADPSPQSQK